MRKNFFFYEEKNFFYEEKFFFYEKKKIFFMRIKYFFIIFLLLAKNTLKGIFSQIELDFRCF